ncbi:NAD(P)-binding protein [Xylariomycetidae sp. FL2044]|nr:NAD(P)-binding protein [Xylariomycetidae sp. FL2044]
MSVPPKTWLITGCSSGFGELFVRRARALGHNVIATGRNADTRLAHLNATGAAILDLDMTAPASEIDAKMEAAWNLYPGGIDVVVNNAGYILSGAIEELLQEELEHVFKTNFYGPINVTKALLPRLRAKGSGTLLYMSSQAAWHADPSGTGYCASKAALEAAVECLSKELAILAPGIQVLIVEPGYFRTKAFGNIAHVPPRVPDYAAFNAGSRAFEAATVGNEPGDAARAVEIMIDLVKNGTGVVVAGGGGGNGEEQQQQQQKQQIPLRVPLGSDGWERIRAKAADMVRICDEWEGVARSTDINRVQT